jgi:hypothetical protein
LTGKGIKLESVRTALVFRPRQAQIAARIYRKINVSTPSSPVRISNLL